MDRALHGLPCPFVYLDNVLVASYSFDNHLVDVRVVLTCLQELKLVINHDKLFFCRDSVEFLGHTVTATGISIGEACCCLCLFRSSHLEERFATVPQPSELLLQFLAWCCRVVKTSD